MRLSRHQRGIIRIRIPRPKLAQLAAQLGLRRVRPGVHADAETEHTRTPQHALEVLGVIQALALRGIRVVLGNDRLDLGQRIRVQFPKLLSASSRGLISDTGLPERSTNFRGNGDNVTTRRSSSAEIAVASTLAAASS
jgi:hypothetical protein